MNYMRDNKGLEVGLYKDMAEWEKLSGKDDWDTERNIENGFLREITCGTYNGATQTFTPWGVNRDNLVETILREAGETNYIEGIEHLEVMEHVPLDELIECYCSDYEVFALEDGTVWTFRG